MTSLGDLERALRELGDGRWLRTLTGTAPTGQPRLFVVGPEVDATPMMRSRLFWPDDLAVWVSLDYGERASVEERCAPDGPEGVIVRVQVGCDDIAVELAGLLVEPPPLVEDSDCDGDADAALSWVLPLWRDQTTIPTWTIQTLRAALDELDDTETCPSDAGLESLGYVRVGDDWCVRPPAIQE